MRDVPYGDLHWHAEPPGPPTKVHEAEGRRAVETVHREELERIAAALSSRQSVLVTCAKSLSGYVQEALETNYLKSAQWEEVTRRPGQTEGPDRIGSVMGHLYRRLEAAFDAVTGRENAVVVVRHLDLMAWASDGRPRGEFSDALFWFSELGGVTKLAFWDPLYEVPAALEPYYPVTVSMQFAPRERLCRMVSEAEARRISPHDECFLVSAQLGLHQYLTGCHVADARRILRALTSASFAPLGGDPTERQVSAVHAHLREQVSPGQVVSPDWGRDLSGYEALRAELESQVVFPLTRRHRLGTEDLARADALLPRGVLLFGEPGTGKTEWAKWLARTLVSTLLVIHGPELKNRLVGETEAAIRRIFQQARRQAPSVILADEIDALIPSRRQADSNFEQSMVAQFLTQMGGLHPDEAVLVVGTTNRLEAIDPACLRPGRFEVQIEVTYPERDDRRQILNRYNQVFQVGLSESALEILADMTEGPLDPGLKAAQAQRVEAFIRYELPAGREHYQAGGQLLRDEVDARLGMRRPPRFSGDHLRGICKHLVLQKLYAAERLGISMDVNDPAILKGAVDSIRRRDTNAAEPLVGSEHSPGDEDQPFADPGRRPV